MHGWAVGVSNSGGGVIIGTSNGGASWQTQLVLPTTEIHAVTSTDDMHAWAVGNAGAIWATADGGSSWQPQSSGTANNLKSVDFTDSLNGWVVGHGDTVLVTTNGGQSWSPRTPAYGGWSNISFLNAVALKDASHAWIAGGGTFIVATADGGYGWKLQNAWTPVNSTLNSIAFVDSSHGWAVGVGGMILATSSGGTGSMYTYAAGTGGSISGEQEQQVAYGGDGTTVVAVADAGYHFVGWSDGLTTPSRTDTNITASKTLTALFAINTYTITTSVGPNGTISPASPSVNHGADRAFSITPAVGYHVATLSVDGSQVTPATSYTFFNVTGPHTIAATFAINTYTLNYSAGPGGAVVGTSPQTVEHNGSGSQVTALPEDGYHFVGWSDGIAANPRTDTGVTRDISVTANFSLNAPPVLNVIGNKTVNELATLTFTATATDADLPANTLTFSLGAGAPSGASMTSAGAFTWTPSAVGSFDVTVQVSDGVLTDAETFTVTAAPAQVTPVEVAGPNRYATAIAASKKAFTSSEYVIIATGANWPDALGGSALAGALDAPILLTAQGSLPAEVRAEIVRLGATKAIVLGGTPAVSAAVAGQIDAIPGVSVERIAGANRYDTANAVAARTIAVMRAGAGYSGIAFVATGANFPDALGASPLAAAKGWPIYLANPNQGNNAGLIATMRAAGVTDAILLGGTNVVADSIRLALGATFQTRLSGANRYDTAVKVAAYGVANAGLAWDKVAIATGQNFPDALAGGVLQGSHGSVLLLTPTASLNDGVAAVLSTNKASIFEVRFLGSTAAVSQTARNQVTNILQR